MELDIEELEQFYRTWWSLLGYVNSKYKCVKKFSAKKLGDPVDKSDVRRIREKLVEDMTVIDLFEKDNPDNLSQEDLDIVKTWKGGVFNKFFIVKHLKNYSVFLTSDRLYGVIGLIESINEKAQPPLPKYVEALLLPYKDKIIYDGLLAIYGVRFGKDIRDELNELYKKLKVKKGITLSLNKQ